ncbi:carboxypeptidase regulatory-like domain-containing protein [Cesiribacter sp. SM1]|uniref:carboxypeptidase regulatory-like domain-containing protein n=1 Tax=Cesiribacter sp. SM1 TaxID=2861196 RepID=UPI001CD7789C|nr:carboxypeptidase regulatory-like domain-containing protein [Cesiribacter sp. SM1]
MQNILSCLLFLLLPFVGSIPAAAQYDNVFFRLKPSPQKGLLLYQAGAYEKAIPFIKQAIEQEHNSQFVLMLAHSYALTGKANDAVRLYRQVGDPQQLEARHLLAYTLCLQSLGRTEEARSSFYAYLGKIGEQTEVAEDLGKSDLYRTAIRYSVHPLSINSRQHEFAPVLTKEGILFVSDRKRGGIVKRSFSSHVTDLDVYKAEARSNTRFVNYTRLEHTVNSSLHEGPATLDTVGNIYFSRSERNGQLSLWFAKARAEKDAWQEAQKIKIPVSGNMFHPAVSADGRLMFFVSDRTDGLGGTDIYYSVLQDGEWSEPVNAGPKVNTPGNESFPVLQESKLYFSSDGRIGLGRLDIYEALLSGTRVIHVRNMGAPLNSSEDDFGLVWLPDGSGGYFASNRKGSRGGDDLYRLDYHVIHLEGTVLDSTNQKPLAGARVELLNPDGSTRQVVTNSAGAYNFTLYPGESYKLNIEAKSYRSRTLSYSTLQGKQYGKRQFQVALERKTKIFVLGNVRLPNKKRASHTQVIVYDMAGGKPDTLQANERGSFEVELDTESTYSFLLGCDALGGVAEFTTSSRTDASLSHYLNIDLTEQQQYKVTGRVEGAEAGKPLVLWLTNSISNEQLLLWPENGRFSFDATSLAGYELCLQQGSKSRTLYLSQGWKEPQREVVLSLQ